MDDDAIRPRHAPELKSLLPFQAGGFSVAEVPADAVPADMKPDKFYEEVVLLRQPFVKDPSQTIEDRIKAAVAKLRENIVIRRFVRFEIGG